MVYKSIWHDAYSKWQNNKKTKICVFYISPFKKKWDAANVLWSNITFFLLFDWFLTFLIRMSKRFVNPVGHIFSHITYSNFYPSFSLSYTFLEVKR